MSFKSMLPSSWPQVGPRWLMLVHVGLSWLQVGPSWLQVGLSWPNLASSCPKLAPSEPQLGPMLAPCWPMLAQVATKLAPSWLQVGPCWPKLVQVGPKLAPRWPQVGPCWLTLAPSWRPQGLPRHPHEGSASEGCLPRKVSCSSFFLVASSCCFFQNEGISLGFSNVLSNCFFLVVLTC